MGPVTSNVLTPFVRLRILTPNAGNFVAPNGDRVTEIEFSSSPTILGRSPDANILLEDAEENVSRKHLAFFFDGTRWKVADCETRNGSRMLDPESGQLEPLIPHVREAIKGKTQLEIGSGPIVEVSISNASFAGPMTKDAKWPKPASVNPPRGDQARLARALIKSTHSHAGASAADLADELGIYRQRVYEISEKLAKNSAVARQLQLDWTDRRPPGWISDLAQAVLKAFPDDFDEYS